MRLAMLRLTSGLFLAAYSMALRALLHGWHIHRGWAWVAVFVRRCTGRGGPHPNTQLNMCTGMGLSKVACGKGCPCGGIATTWWSKLSLLCWLPSLALFMGIPMAWGAEELAMLFSADWLAMMNG